MVREAVAVVIAALLLPSSVQAAPFGEVPPELVEHDYALTDCARPTGLAGEVVAPVGLHRYDVDNSAQFYEATPAGLVAASRVVFSGAINDCAVAAAQPSGAGVVAAPMDNSDTIGYALREPGASVWGPLASIPTERNWLAVTAPAVAVSPAGDAVIAWVETPLIEGGKPLARVARRIAPPANRLRVARRVAGQPFGAPETLGSLPAVFPPALQVGIASTGEAIVAVALVADGHRALCAARSGARRRPARRSASRSRSARSRATRTPRWRSPRTATRCCRWLTPKACWSPSALSVFGFTAAVRVARTRDPLGFDTNVALDPTGAAAVLWSGKALGGVGISSRVGPGRFRAPQVLAAADTSIRYDLFAGFSATDFGYLASPINLAPGAWGYDRARHSLALAGTDAILAWSDPSGGQTLATVPLAGGPATTASVRACVAPSRAPFAMTLRDGRPAMLWTDVVTQSPAGTYRMRLATRDVADDAAPLPAVRVGTPLDTSLRATQELVLPVRCDTPCEVRGQVGGSTRSLTLPQGGASRLHLRPTGPLAPARPVRSPCGSPPARSTGGPPRRATTPSRSDEPRAVRSSLTCVWPGAARSCMSAGTSMRASATPTSRSPARPTAAVTSSPSCGQRRRPTAACRVPTSPRPVSAGSRSGGPMACAPCGCGDQASSGSSVARESVRVSAPTAATRPTTTASTA